MKIRIYVSNLILTYSAKFIAYLGTYSIHTFIYEQLSKFHFLED